MVMQKLELLNSERHHNIKIRPSNNTDNNAQVHMSHIVLTELIEVAQYYPIFFTKDGDTGKFQPVALFGLAVDENIYQTSGLWKKCYLPLKMQSQPFYLINKEQQGECHASPGLAIDINDPRISKQQGESLFIDHKATPYLQTKAAILAELTQGFLLNSTFIALLLAHDLLETITLDIKYIDGQKHKVDGLYTINKDMLKRVPADTQQQFEQQGYVELISAVLSSNNHLATLIDIKNSSISLQQVNLNTG